MSRQETITKMCRAIRSYRGATRGKDNDGRPNWTVLPKVAERRRIIAYLEKLGADPVKEMEYIDTFVNIDDFNQWVRATFS